MGSAKYSIALPRHERKKMQLLGRTLGTIGTTLDITLDTHPNYSPYSYREKVEVADHREAESILKHNW